MYAQNIKQTKQIFDTRMKYNDNNNNNITIYERIGKTTVRLMRQRTKRKLNVISRYQNEIINAPIVYSTLSDIGKLFERTLVVHNKKHE